MGRVLKEGSWSQEGTLEVELRGRKILLEDDLKTKTLRYTYKGFSERHGLYLFWVRHYESHDYLLIRYSDGKRYMIPDPPVFSPDQSRFVSVSEALETGYEPGELPGWLLGPMVLYENWVGWPLLGKRPYGTWRTFRYGYGTHLYYDSTKARTELGLPQTPVEDAIRKAIGWFREHGYLGRRA